MAARNMIPSSSTRNLLLSTFREHRRRLLSSSSSESNPNPNPNPNPSNWPPPVRGMPIYDTEHIDLGRWIFRTIKPEIKSASVQDLYKLIIKAVGESIGSEAEAQKRIYFVSTWQEGLEFWCYAATGFGGYFDKETKDKIMKDVEWIHSVHHDLYYEARESHPTTRAVRTRLDISTEADIETTQSMI